MTICLFNCTPGVKKSLRFLFVVLCFGAYVPQSHSAPLLLDKDVSVKPLTGIARYAFLDEDSGPVEARRHQDWNPVRDSVMPLEEGKALWLRIELEQSASASGHYRLTTPAPWTNSVTFIHNRNGLETVQESGTGAFVDHRYSRPTLDLELAPGELVTVYVRLHSYRRVPSEFIIYSESAHLSKQATRYTLLGLFGGTVLMLVLLNGLMYGGLRDPLLSRYILWMISVGVYFVFRTRLSLILLPPALAGYSQWMHTVAVCLTAISAIRFGRYYLSTGQKSSITDLAARMLQYAAALPIAFLPFKAEVAHELSALAGLFVGPPMFIIALIGLKRGARDSYLFLCAWSLPIVAAMAENLSFVTARMENRIYLPVAFLLEFLLFSLVIRRKIRESESHRIANEVTLNRVNQELGFARKIQRDLMPSSEHQLNGAKIQVYYEPQHQVGGDYCDVVYPDNEHVGLFVADVTGHGMTAALDAALVRLALRSVYQGKRSAAETLAAINGFLYTHLQLRFVSAIYCVLNLRTGFASISAAGHPPGLLARPDLEPEFFESTGPLLGVMEQWEGEDATMTLGQGDRLYLYTDGLFRTDYLSEPDDANAELVFARERELFLAAGESLTDILERSRQLRGGPATDDVALIQLQYSRAGLASR